MKQVFNGSLLLVVSALCLPLAAASESTAESYPSKAIRLICPFPAGGAVDFVARFFAQRMAPVLGQQVFVDNRGGAGGIIGMEAGAHAPADGYTVTVANLSVLSINPFLYSKLPYDTVRDFAPVIELAQSVNLLVVHPSLPVKSVKDLIALAKANPGALNYASPGNGTPAHLATELLNSMSGMKMVHVPYKGAGAAIPAMLAGESQVYIEPVATMIPHVHSGRMRALAVTSAKRTSVAPELPTVMEAGVPGFEFTSWYGVIVPAATPVAVVTRLNATLNRILTQADVSEQLTSQAMLLVGGTPEAFSTKMKAEMARWGKVVKDTGTKAN
jgi:tripartite-type tricarboxylate transporter receptor subunit TctC